MFGKRRFTGLAAAATCFAAVATLAAFGLPGPGYATVPVPAQRPNGNCLQPPSTCYGVPQFRRAYGIQPLLEHGVDGRGRTVVLLEEAESGPAQPPGITDIRQDLSALDDTFGLPSTRLQVDTRLAGSAASPWLANNEEVEDTEVVHAVAPHATIREIPMDPADLTPPAKALATIDAALRLAASDGDVVSLSASIGEHFLTAAQIGQMHAALRNLADHRVTMIASTGDYGAVSDEQDGIPFTPVKEASVPASDPLVLAVGGTRLSADARTGVYLGETAWNTLPKQEDDHSSATGGGFSHRFNRPDYQTGITGTGATRGVPDVAGDAAFDTGMACVQTNVAGQGHLIRPATGTSAAAPLWAGLVALADQLAHRDLGVVNPAIYRIARDPASRAALHDTTMGDNTFATGSTMITGYRAARGWDPTTGWGTPNAQALIPLLARTGEPTKATP